MVIGIIILYHVSYSVWVFNEQAIVHIGYRKAINSKFYIF